MTIKYANPENKVFSGIIVTGVDRKKILKSLSNKGMAKKSLVAFNCQKNFIQGNTEVKNAA
jgi:hypothetical protein